MPKNKETLCFFVFLCFHKQTKQTLEVLSFMKLEQIIFVKEAVSFILRKQDILVKEVISFIMKKQDNFLKEVVSFLKKLLVSRKQMIATYILYYIYPTSHNIHCLCFGKYWKLLENNGRLWKQKYFKYRWNDLFWIYDNAVCFR